MTVPLNGPQPPSPLSPYGEHSAMITLITITSAIAHSSSLHTGPHALQFWTSLCMQMWGLKNRVVLSVWLFNLRYKRWNKYFYQVDFQNKDQRFFWSVLRTTQSGFLQERTHNNSVFGFRSISRCSDVCLCVEDSASCLGLSVTGFPQVLISADLFIGFTNPNSAVSLVCWTPTARFDAAFLELSKEQQERQQRAASQQQSPLITVRAISKKSWWVLQRPKSTEEISLLVPLFTFSVFVKEKEQRRNPTDWKLAEQWNNRTQLIAHAWLGLG